MPNWRTGLVEAFPIPEDRRPGYKKKKKAATQDAEIQQLEDNLSDLAISIPTEPFRFVDLPSELRNRVYDYVLFSKPEYRSARRRGSRVACLLVNKKMHEEAAYILYTTHKFKVFPVQLFDAPPTVVELPLRYLPYVANIEMVVGPSWTDPPKSWRITRGTARCLKRLTSVQTLRVFVEFDPSHPAFARYRKSYSFYTDYCGDLLGDVLEVMPQVRQVELDGNPGVDVHGPLVSRLKEEILEQDKEVKWGKQANWAHKLE